MILIIANIASLIAWILIIKSYHKENINQILLIQIMSSIFYCISYLLLGAWSGLLICFFELIKEHLYYKTDLDDYVFIASLFIYILIAYFTYDGFFTLLPVLASIIDGYSLTKNKNVAVIGAVLSYSLWVIYDLIILSYSGAITDGILVLSNLSILLLGYSNLIKSNNIIITKCSYLSKTLLDYIDKLDNEIYEDKYIWDKDYQKLIYEKNKDSLYILKYKNKIIGYINYLCITEKEYNGIKKSETYIKKYNDNEIVKYNRNSYNYIIIESIGVDPKYQNYRVAKMIKNKLEYIIKDNYKKGFKIKSIIAIPVNDFEKDIVKSCNFISLKKYNSLEELYELNYDLINENIITKKFKQELKDKEYIVYSNSNITNNILESIYDLDSKYYNKEYLWDKQYQKDVYNKNNNSIIAVTKKDKLIGYINYICISKSRYDYIKETDRIIDNYELVDIKEFIKKKNYITINSALIEEKYRDSITIKLLTNNLKKELKKLDKNGFKIDGICGTAISKDGRKLLEQMGFIRIKNLNDGNYLYVLEHDNLKEFIYK